MNSKKKSERTEALQFDKNTIKAIQQRDDYSCLYCKYKYEKQGIYPPNKLEYLTHDIAHFINKSQGGLGIPENGFECCRYHHGLLDNGNKGQRKMMLEIAENYLRSIYPGWNRNDLIYKK